MVFGTILAAFGVGAAIGAYVTVQVPALTLGIPVTFLLIACCVASNGEIQSRLSEQQADRWLDLDQASTASATPALLLPTHASGRER